MARDPNTPALAADYDLLLAQLTTMRDEMSRLAAQVAASATQNGKAMAETATAGLHDARHYATRQAHEVDLRVERAIVDMLPVGHVGLPSEVAAAVLFLASDESSYVAGAELVVDGGMSQV